MTSVLRKYALTALREARVRVVHARSMPNGDMPPHEVMAKVQGHFSTYTVALKAGTWSCTCGKDQPCGHRTAVGLVTGHTPKAVMS